VKFAAAVFDLDGVITFTARVHEAAWKDVFDAFLRERADQPFQAFTQDDYRSYVDGRPRYDGVRTFLHSRGIELPFGDPDDGPEQETVCGLGNRKQLLFRERLERAGAEVDRAAVDLVRELRAAGVRVGVASSSKNTGLILERAGLADLFEAQVDGVMSERLRLQGKPAPDIFLKCLELLAVRDPQRALVAEDAEVGVEAGRAGGFGLVLGVDRGERALALREHGANWIVRDFAALSHAQLESYFENRAHLRPNALSHWSDLAAQMQGRRPAIFLDYDGTLTPIVSRPHLARLTDEMRATLRRLAAAWPTTVVSGRGREDAQTLVAVDELHYAGSHGFDIAGPGADGLRYEVDPSIAPAMADAAAELESSTAGIPGILVENKKYSVAVHYRLVPQERVADVERAVDDAITVRPQLRKQPGKKIFELRPALDWDKGRAVLWLLESLGLDRDDVIPIYIGDDTTDEDAFRALEGRGIGILVAEVPRPTAASHSLQDVEEVRVLLERLVEPRASHAP
jgi:trehalose 6-phosphate phosphatase